MHSSSFGASRAKSQAARRAIGSEVIHRGVSIAAGSVVESLEGRQLLSTAIAHSVMQSSVSPAAALTAPAATIASTTTLSSSANPAVAGQSIVLTATVVAGATGTVTFHDGNTVLGTGTLNGAGQAVFTMTDLSVASHSLTASYIGDATYDASTSAPLAQAVNRASTSVSISSTSGTTAPVLAKPSHVVIVIEEDRYANAIGDTANMPYLNQLAASGLVLNNSHGLNSTSQTGQMNYLALYSGSTQGVTDDGNNGLFSGPNLAQSLANAGLSFSGYSESLPSSGDTTDNYAAAPGNPAYDDLYTRAYNPMAQFSDVGTGVSNAAVNQTFASFPTSAAGYAALPTVSFVVPNTLHNTHGSNDADPFATDPDSYNLLRNNADTWLQQNISSYAQWAAQNNSLLIVTGEEGDRAHNFAAGFPTIINGASNLVAPGVNSTNVTPYTILRTVEDMYGLPRIGSTASAAGLPVNAAGQLGTPAAVGSSLVGQNVTFTATVGAVAPGAGVPTGTVQFAVDGASLGSPVALIDGSATCPAVAFATPGAHAVTATYSSDSQFSEGAPANFTQNVSQHSASVALSANLSSAVSGQTITFTANVTGDASSSANPSGTVTFEDGSTVLGTSALDSAGSATFATSSLRFGPHSITAVYEGDSTFAPATSDPLSEPVSAASSSATLTSSASAVPFGQNLALTATVSAVAPGAGVPSGTVNFMEGAALLGTGTLDSSGVATFNISSLSVGTHGIVAAYLGDANFAAATSPTLNESITPLTPATSSTSVSSSLNPSITGQAVTFTANVVANPPGGGTPTGTVQFLIDGVNFGSPVALTNGSAVSPAVNTLSATSHAITATYSGDTLFSSSVSPALTQTVSKASTIATVASSLNPSVVGQTVTFTATISAVAPGSGTPTGSVTFSDGASVLGTGVLDSTGHAAWSTTSLTAGPHAITASYVGDANMAGASSPILSENVNPASSGLPNDNFASATPISGATATLEGSNVGATKETGEPNHAGNSGGHSVWWTWTAPAAGQVTIDTAGSDFDTLLAVYTGSSVSALTAVPGGSNDDNPAGGLNTSRVSFPVVANTTYRIAVDGYNGATGNIALHVNLGTAAAPAAPTGVAASIGAFSNHVHVSWNSSSSATAYEVWRSTANSTTTATKISAADVTSTSYDDATAASNVAYFYWIKAKNAGGTSGFSASAQGALRLTNDAFAAASVITGISATLHGSNVGATREAGEPNHAGQVGGHSVWWTWTAPSSGLLTLDTSGSNFDTLLAVYTGTSVSALTAVPGGSNDDNPAGGNTSKVSFSAVAGKVYRIAVDGYSGAMGAITLHLSLGAPAAPTKVLASQGTYSNHIHVSWGASIAATTYEVWRSTTNSSSSAVKINTATVTTTAYDDTTARTGVQYYYWIKARNAAGASGFSASAHGWLLASNDVFANAQVISGTSASLTGSNVGATKQTGEPNHAGNVGGHSVWWTWTATTSGTVSIDTHGSNFDTLLAVYTGSSVSGLTAVPGGSNDDDPAGGTNTSKVSFKVTAGAVYRIAVDGYNGASGSIALHLAHS